MSKNLILAITTYNRLSKLKRQVDSFLDSAGKLASWQIIIADDGSTDGTLEYLDNLTIPDIQITVIKNNRQGVHHQFNTIVQELKKIDFDYCFKCDDDIEFVKPGWDKLYTDAIEQSGYYHLCHFDPAWRPEKNFKKPVLEGTLVSYCTAKDVQGAFFTLTPKVIEKVGYMDTKNFGFRGVGHVDYTMRACRASFNDLNHPFDATDSHLYIQHQKAEYKSAMNVHVQNALENNSETKRKYSLVNDSSRLYIPFYKQAPSLTEKVKYNLLNQRLDELEKEKQWYEETYGHQPRWFIRLGKLLRMFQFWR